MQHIDREIPHLSRRIDRRLRLELRKAYFGLRDHDDRKGAAMALEPFAWDLLELVYRSVGRAIPAKHAKTKDRLVGLCALLDESKSPLPAHVKTVLHHGRVIANRVKHKRHVPSLRAAESVLEGLLQVLQWFYCECETGPKIRWEQEALDHRANQGMALQIDRDKQWRILKDLCEGGRDTLILLHGEADQSAAFFLRRVAADLAREVGQLQVHRVASASSTWDSPPATSQGWLRWMADDLRGRSEPLTELGCALAGTPQLFALGPLDVSAGPRELELEAAAAAPDARESGRSGVWALLRSVFGGAQQPPAAASSDASEAKEAFESLRAGLLDLVEHFAALARSLEGPRRALLVLVVLEYEGGAGCPLLVSELQQRGEALGEAFRDLPPLTTPAREDVDHILRGAKVGLVARKRWLQKYDSDIQAGRPLGEILKELNHYLLHGEPDEAPAAPEPPEGSGEEEDEDE